MIVSPQRDNTVTHSAEIRISDQSGDHIADHGGDCIGDHVVDRIDVDRYSVSVCDERCVRDLETVLYFAAWITNTKLGLWIFNPLFMSLMGIGKIREITVQDEASFVPFVKPDNLEELRKEGNGC